MSVFIEALWHDRELASAYFYVWTWMQILLRSEEPITYWKWCQSWAWRYSCVHSVAKASSSSAERGDNAWDQRLWWNMVGAIKRLFGAHAPLEPHLQLWLLNLTYWLANSVLKDGLWWDVPWLLEAVKYLWVASAATSVSAVFVYKYLS